MPPLLPPFDDIVRMIGSMYGVPTPKPKTHICCKCGAPTPDPYFVPLAGMCDGCANAELAEDQEFRWGEQREERID